MSREVFDPLRTRVVLSQTIVGDNIIIYTVPPNCNFYLEEVSLSIALLGQGPWGSGYCNVYWLRSDAYYVRDLCQIWLWAQEKNGQFIDCATQGDHAIFPSFLKIPANDMIMLVAQAWSVGAEGNISGFLVTEPGEG